MKYLKILFVLMFLPMVSWAETSMPKNKSEKEITMTTTEAMQLAGALVDKGDFKHATQILTMTPKWAMLHWKLNDGFCWHKLHKSKAIMILR
jgi:hypothetical protein